MNQTFVERFMENKMSLEYKFNKHPKDYKEIVKWVIETIMDEDEDYNYPNPDIIHEIDDGDYQGTILFVIPAKTYQPSKYFYVKIQYGSCSACDTLQSIQDNYDFESGDRFIVNDQQKKDYMTLALHIIQGLKEM